MKPVQYIDYLLTEDKWWSEEKKYTDKWWKRFEKHYSMPKELMVMGKKFVDEYGMREWSLGELLNRVADSLHMGDGYYHFHPAKKPPTNKDIINASNQVINFLYINTNILKNIEKIQGIIRSSLSTMQTKLEF